MTLNISDVPVLGQSIITEVEKTIIGKTPLIEQALAAILAKGHVLLEDYPGLAKTLLANSLATVLGLGFKRIQFVPDLLPGDITGGYVYDREKNCLNLRKGPLFTNIVLADEINRASPKTQSALLEAMQEGRVTIEGETLPLPEPFMVIATQNPIEYEGTFPLPEAQLDRFIMRLSVGYPSSEEEVEILKRRKARKQDAVTLNAMTDGNQVIAMQRAIEEVYIDPDIERYIVALVKQTRNHSRVRVGASPRGSLALLKLALANAALNGRDYVLPDDVKRFVKPALVHRLVLNPDLWLNKNAALEVINAILSSVPVPVLEAEAE